MFGIRFVKAPPTTYVIHFKDGRAVREGPGLSFFFWGPGSQIVMVPIASADVPFAFTETTADFQTVTVQGQLTRRVADPRRLASLLDYSIGADGRWAGDDHEKLDGRLVAEAQILTSAYLQKRSLKDALRGAEGLAAHALAGLQAAPGVSMLGVEILGFAVLSIRPTPDMARALEAEAREALQQDADQALYARRNYAVEQERRIKESELSTEIAVEEKKRQIRETQVGADIAVEERRRALVDLRIANEKKEADSKGYALQEVLRPLGAVDWKTLVALGKADPRAMIALAFREIAENAEKIGSLNITPDLLDALMEKK
jgi:hypothetical protein